MAISAKKICLIYVLILHLLSNTQTYASSPRQIATRRLENDGSIDTYYMTNHCRELFLGYLVDEKYVFLNDQAFVMAHPMEEIERSPKYVRYDVCVATFAAPPGYELLIHFQDLAIDYRKQYKSRLHIYNGFEFAGRMSPFNGLFGETQGSSGVPNTNLVMKDYVSSRHQALTLKFTGYFSKRFYGFKALLTSVKRPLKNGTCPRGFFRCVRNWYCIHNTLVCNKISNCGEGDVSDEGSRCEAKAYQLTSPTLDDLGLMIGCGVSILILLMAIIWVGVVCHRRLNRIRRQRQPLTDPGQTTWHTVDDSPPESEQSRWIPRSLYDSVSPWLCREAPPAYTESAPTNQTSGQFKPPPPYNKDNNENQSLIPTAPPQSALAMDGDMGLRANIITNPMVPCIERGEAPPSYQPPSYEESNKRHSGIRCSIVRAPQAPRAALAYAPEAAQSPNTPQPKTENDTGKIIENPSNDCNEAEPPAQANLDGNRDAKFSPASDV